MKTKKNTATATPFPRSKQALLRDTGKTLKLKTGLKAGMKMSGTDGE